MSYQTYKTSYIKYDFSSAGSLLDATVQRACDARVEHFYIRVNGDEPITLDGAVVNSFFLRNGSLLRCRNIIGDYDAKKPPSTWGADYSDAQLTNNEPILICQEQGAQGFSMFTHSKVPANFEQLFVLLAIEML